MIPILVEPLYLKSIWCANLLEGLTTELRLKRLLFRTIESLEQVRKEDDYIYLIGSNLVWVRAMLSTCNTIGCYPILLCNQIYHAFDADYSTVCSDIEGSMRSIVDTLHYNGKNRMAVYGINEKSSPDKSRLDSLLAVKKDLPMENLFFNRGSLENCYFEFKQKQNEIDIVVCVNNFTAISLVRKLKKENPDELRRLIIIGCSETRLSDYYAENIFSMRVNFKKYGKAAVVILENLKKNPHLAHNIMMIKCDIDFLHLPESKSLKKYDFLPMQGIVEVDDEFYEDAELHEMMRFEHLLNESDEIDKKIISLLTQNYSYEAIAKECFLTDSSIKYRTKKMMKICEINSKSELADFLKNYLD